MAYLKQAKSEEDIKKLTVAGVKKEYNSLASDYNRLVNLDYIYCPICGEFKAASGFYSSNKTKSGVEHLGCKSCILDMATDYDKKTGIRTDNKEKTIDVFRKLDLPFIESAYRSSLDSINEGADVKNRSTAFTQLLVMVKSLPQWNKGTFKDSEIDIDTITDESETKENQKIIKSGKKRFGRGYSNEDLMFLETEYQDWTKRYTCENKAQEILFKRICFKELDINKAQKEGKDTKELDKTLQELMGSLSVKPSQSNSNALTEAKTFGQLIQKWEDEWDGGKPLPEIDEDFKDVDKVGLYVDVFFKGHLSKMMGLKNAFSSLYEKFMSKYTVKKPEYEEDTDTEALFDQIFGSKVDDE